MTTNTDTSMLMLGPDCGLMEKNEEQRLYASMKSAIEDNNQQWIFRSLLRIAYGIAARPGLYRNLLTVCKQTGVAMHNQYTAPYWLNWMSDKMIPHHTRDPMFQQMVLHCIENNVEYKKPLTNRHLQNAKNFLLIQNVSVFAIYMITNHDRISA
ncbi:MAG: hypothetical protein ACO3QV_02135 [Candidatus Nanopelagicaceae bacterium]